MTLLQSLTVRGKLVAAFSFVLALMALLGGLAWLQMARINAQTEQILTYRVAGIRDSGAMVAAATRLRTREYRIAVSKPEEVATAAGRYQQAVETFDKASKLYSAFLFDDEEKKLYAAAIAGWNQYMEVSAKIVAAAKAGRMEESLSMVLGASKNFDVAMEGMNALMRYNDDHAKTDAAAAKALHTDSGIYVVAMVLVASALAIGLGVLIARAITRPLNEAVLLAEAVAAGDLTRDIEVRGRDEIATLSHALRAMVLRLRSVVSDVRHGVESVSTASTEISMGNADLSQRTEEQAANLQQTAASMEQLTSTVRQNADNARAASQLAQSARDVAARGGEVVGNVVTTMGAITDSSKRIADIISVIDGIAFQTNILALNAAVEAARAGEQGRGFAVVAAEVRALAQRSAGAAKEIKALIEQSVEKVGDGARLVSEAGETMANIVSQVQRVNDLVGEISSASIEQTQGIEQVGEAVSQLDQVTQQNAALVEESAAAADSMKQQAHKLAETMAVFDVGTSPLKQAPVAPRSAAPRPPARHAQARAAAPGSAGAGLAKQAPNSKSAAVDADQWASF